MNILGNGFQLTAFIVLSVAILAGLMIIADTIAFLLYEPIPAFRVPPCQSDYAWQVSKRLAAVE
jgi:hypothetical protein